MEDQVLSDKHDGFAVPETRVLAVASHVLHGYVGNTVAAFVMQSLGCEVAALNTVQYSNHVGYRQFTGTRTTAAEISELYKGLKDSSLDDFNMMLSGYVPGAEAVEAVGSIGRDQKLNSSLKPGSFFWVLDPVMGDNGKLYVSEDVVPVYKKLVGEADLILPNQYEAEWLSGVKIVDMSTLTEAIRVLHMQYRVPHILISSICLPTPGSEQFLSVVGSTISSDNGPRIFRINVPALGCFFSGTGDMFAALMVVRMREAVSSVQDLAAKASWISDDDVAAVELPLARAAEKALASMQVILQKTKDKRDAKLLELGEDTGEKAYYLKKTRAAEVLVVRNVYSLKHPEVAYKAEEVDVQIAS